jgi:hypothetical protein
MISGTHAIVIGYHGCDKTVGQKILKGIDKLQQSRNKYDWLGHGAYFWENNYERAYLWAEQLKARKKIKTPFVLGAVISLGNCFDLLSGDHLKLLKNQYKFTKKLYSINKSKLPANPEPNSSGDVLSRPLECSIIEAVHNTNKLSGKKEYDTVRGVFFEGKELFPGSALTENNHIQLCVRKQSAILGYFNPNPR